MKNLILFLLLFPALCFADAALIGEESQTPSTAYTFDERFEGAGYEETGWTETIVGGTTIDEDALSSTVSSPSGWGTQCLEIVNVGNASYTYNATGITAITYYRMEFVITAEGIANTEDFDFIQMYDNTGGTLAAELVLYQNSSGVLKLILNSRHDGTENNYTCLTDPSLNTRYRFEIKWDATNNKWAWKIDGVNQPNDQDSVDPITVEGNLSGTHETNMGLILIGSGVNTRTYTTYYDLIAKDTAWIGAE